MSGTPAPCPFPMTPLEKLSPRSRVRSCCVWAGQLCSSSVLLRPLPSLKQVQSGAPSSPAQQVPTALRKATVGWKTACPAPQGPSAPVGPPSLCYVHGKGSWGGALLELSYHVFIEYMPEPSTVPDTKGSIKIGKCSVCLQNLAALLSQDTGEQDRQGPGLRPVG